MKGFVKMEKISLDGNWKLCEQGSMDSIDVTVPGTVLLAYLQNGRVKDPFVGRNEYEVRDMLDNVFEFSREFEIPESLIDNNKNFVLVCEGLDTLANIRINGYDVLKTDNMHRTWTADIRKYLMSGRNEISVKFDSVFKYIREYKYIGDKEIEVVPTGCMKGDQLIRKAHSMFGWDWGPQLPDVGIFRSIYINVFDKNAIKDVYIRQKHENGKVSLHYTVEMEKETYLTEMPCVSLYDPEGMLISKNNDIDSTIDISEPQIWWPNEYGDQPLYILVAEYDGKKIEKKIGLRTLTISREKDEYGREFAFVVNGIKIFAMGADYIPEDCLYTRITKEKQRFLLNSAKKAHFNCIRVWGGGYYPSNEFYDMCDELGIIVWQDLMFACNVYDVTEKFIINCEQEVRDNVRRLRHHASLGLWCGNNEIESAWSGWKDYQNEPVERKNGYLKLFEECLAKVVKEEDPDTFWWPSSPSSGGNFVNTSDENDGDAHYWEVWHGQKPFTEYRKHYFRFMSEFGFQSFPCLSTIDSFAEEKDKNIFSPVMESHQKNDAANGKILYYLSENFRYPKNFENLVYISQVLQAEAIRYGVEHMRRNRGRCMGAIYWQLNDNWPVASWSSVDYFNNWKALMYSARHFFAPVAISVVTNKNCVEAYIENETFEKVFGKVTIEVKTIDLHTLYKETFEGSCEGLTSACVGKITDLDIDAEKCFTVVSFEREGYETLYVTGTFVPIKMIELAESKIDVTVKKEKNRFVIKLDSNVFTPFVEIGLRDHKGCFSDNYFDLFGKERCIVINNEDIEGAEITDAAQFGKLLTIKSVRDTY